MAFGHYQIYIKHDQEGVVHTAITRPAQIELYHQLHEDIDVDNKYTEQNTHTKKKTYSTSI